MRKNINKTDSLRIQNTPCRASVGKAQAVAQLVAARLGGSAEQVAAAISAAARGAKGEASLWVGCRCNQRPEAGS
ncbi:hypothetical protein [Microbulbifer sp. PSTR4-B]|uniref:hypothetical protein n=1 Tax=unclassified Microbulbifer TaxID=2619833 RepID=UPI00403ABE54